MRKDMSKLNATLEVLKSDAKMKQGDFDSYQNNVFKEQEEIVKIIKAEVIRCLTLDRYNIVASRS